MATQIWVNIGLDNCLSPDQCQAIIRTNTGVLLIGPLGTKLNEILIKIQQLSFKKMHLKMSSAKFCPFCHGLNVLISCSTSQNYSYSSHFIAILISSHYTQAVFKTQSKKLSVLMPWIWNHKHRLKKNKNKSSQSFFKVVSFGQTDER